jgi:NDP-sugar pyrophosphorylase family protein
MKAEELFSLPDEFLFRSFFSPDDAPWEWIRKIKDSFDACGVSPNPDTFPSLSSGVVVDGPVYIDRSAKIGPNVVINGPAYIGPMTELRPGAFLRGNVIIGEACVVGNSSELKNCMLLNHVQVPHFNYVGDSILGNGVHLGAGVICSNLRLDRTKIPVKLPAGHVDSGLVKLGAMIGDETEVGCNAVLNPGTILGKRSLVYPCMSFGGYLDADAIAAPKQQEVRTIRRR